MTARGPARRLVWAVVLCSLVVKLAGVAYMQRYLAWNLVAPDTRDQYRPLAVSLVEGRGYQFHGDHADATRIAPGFPVFLAAIYGVAGPDAPTWLIGAINAVLRTLTTIVVFALASRAFGGWAAWWAAVVHALDPWEAFWTAFVLKESLAVLLSVFAMLAVASALESPTFIRGIAAGVAIAVAALTRYASLGLAGAAIALVVWRRHALRSGGAVRLAVTLAAGLVIGLAPWLVRNAGVYGRPMLYLHSGYAFYVSNGPGTERVRDTSGYAGSSAIDASASADVARRHPGPVERDAAYLAAATAHAASHPLETALTAGARLANMWRPTFAGASAINVLVLGGSHVVLLIAAVVGWRVDWKHGGDAPARAVVYAAVGFYLLLHLLFWSEIRYRQYVTPFLAMFAGVAADAAWRRWSRSAIA